MKDMKEKILSIIKEKGPIIPADVSGAIGQTLFITAVILSEMVKEKLLMMSHVKIGSSPLYFLPGQEGALEKYTNYLPVKERNVFELLKKKEIIDDSTINYAEKVAIRNIKDFAIPMKASFGGEEKIFWRVYFIPKEQAIEKISILVNKYKPKVKKDVTKDKKEPKLSLLISKQKPIKLTQSMLALKEKVEDFAKRNNINIVSEEIKGKDLFFAASVNSDIGRLQYLMIAKDKKSISEGDLSLAYNKGQSQKLPVLFLSTGKLSKKGEKYAESLKGHLIFRKL